MTFFRAGIVDEPAADAHRGKTHKSAAAAVIGQNGLVEGQHGHAQFVVPALSRDAADELGGLGFDEAQVLTDEFVRLGRIMLRFPDLGDNLMFLTHPLTRFFNRLRRKKLFFGVGRHPAQRRTINIIAQGTELFPKNAIGA